MLLIIIFIIFCAIFTSIRQNINKFELHINDLLTSFGSYARLHGKLPESKNGGIPWDSIGISSTFFPGCGDLKYEPNPEFMQENLISVDCAHWMLDNIVGVAMKPLRHSLSDVNVKNICQLSGVAFTLKNKTLFITVSHSDLIFFMKYSEYYHKTDYKTLTKNDDGGVSYPTMSMQVSDYLF